ncbi:MAG: regulatory iron-sulfur-containing complex subunit RicT [bacterium]
MRTVKIKLYEGAESEEFNACALNITINDKVLVKKNDNIFLGVVSGMPEIKNNIQELSGIAAQIPLVLRKVNDNEDVSLFQYHPKEDEGFIFCNQKVKELGLLMKLLKVKYLSSENKMIFYYSAEERVDFRELVKVLAAKFHLRIEMRQINIRDECKLLGGIGLCGRMYCCNSVIKELAPITLKAASAKFQKQNSGRMIGSCGRLLCCFMFCSSDDDGCGCGGQELKKEISEVAATDAAIAEEQK